MEPAPGECPRCVRWRTTRAFAWHALLVIGAFATVSALLRRPPLRESALPLLVFWCLGAVVCGAVSALSLACPCRRRKAARR